MSKEQMHVSIDELAGFDLSEVREARSGEVLPRMVGVFEVKEAGLQTVGQDDKAAVVFVNEVVGVLAVPPPKPGEEPADPESLLGRKHVERRVITNPQSVEFLKGFFVDIGVGGSGKVQELCEQAVGKRFVAMVTHRKDKDDADVVYAGLTKVKPYTA